MQFVSCFCIQSLKNKSAVEVGVVERSCRFLGNKFQVCCTGVYLSFLVLFQVLIELFSFQSTLDPTEIGSKLWFLHWYNSGPDVVVFVREMQIK